MGDVLNGGVLAVQCFGGRSEGKVKLGEAGVVLCE